MIHDLLSGVKHVCMLGVTQARNVSLRWTSLTPAVDIPVLAYRHRVTEAQAQLLHVVHTPQLWSRGSRRNKSTRNTR